MQPGIRSNKLDYLSFLAKENNTVIISLTESHLKERVDDAEIHIEGFSITRSDRVIREGGGVVVYIKDHLTVSNELRESDSINDLLGVYINELNIAYITMYRPPDSTIASFQWSLRKVSEWIRKIQTKFEGVRILVNGDFNLGKLGDWNQNLAEDLRDNIKRRVENKD